MRNDRSAPPRVSQAPTVALPGFDGSEPAEIIERYLDEVRRMIPAERLQHAAALSQEILDIAFRGFQAANQHLSTADLTVEFARITWGDQVAAMHAAALTR